MASRMIFHAKPKYIYPTLDQTDNPITSFHNQLEFDEADLYSSNEGSTHQETKKTIPISSRSTKKHTRKVDIGDRKTTVMGSSASSLPMNIPDWSKILREDYQSKDDDENFDDDNYDGDDDDQDGRVPPHEYLARRRGASFSVHEGIGRTLKGRDLRRVRNAVWEKVGFED
ncbi:Senescence_reg domain-containing protein [Cephalotus follicularis]|uniref:Senescence_reg domain-containing protein n=1 Tax=Cephalotus follicularis TaxID=3775 RepID=A0A1Q3B9H3_CEPFO|nr:Senescence_reg domain-containing protein [Cephalotus follicularis]